MAGGLEVIQMFKKEKLAAEDKFKRKFVKCCITMNSFNIV